MVPGAGALTGANGEAEPPPDDAADTTEVLTGPMPPARRVAVRFSHCPPEAQVDNLLLKVPGDWGMKPLIKKAQWWLDEECRQSGQAAAGCIARALSSKRLPKHMHPCDTVRCSCPRAHLHYRYAAQYLAAATSPAAC